MLPMKKARQRIIDTLLSSDEPSIRWKVLVGVLGEDPGSREIGALREQIRNSARARAMLAARDVRSARGWAVYLYLGPHWALSALADIGYPAADESLLPIRDRVVNYWLSDPFYKEFESAVAVPKRRGAEGVPNIRGRYRRCASQQGNALYSISKLGLIGSNGARLVERLLHWQWPDGGWNCDRRPSADTSSFMESLLPMRGLAVYAQATGDNAAREAALRASEVFLSRRIFRRRSDGKVIRPDFLMLHYPLYWHYDILGALKAMAEMGLATDPRCGDALDLLERKELPDGGWPAQGRFYRTSSDANGRVGSASAVDWGRASRRRMNQWVTADALYVLRAAGRL